jgi:D-beta-D-heptose 7-phosphate kinase/D-beta-D-heptose 1-phosphate adenosyltransferase
MSLNSISRRIAVHPMSNLHDIFEQLCQQRRRWILVLGDLMLDRYTWGDAERVSPEAPVIVLRADQEEIRPGGAASVAYLLPHLEADVTLAGVVGNDSDGHTLRALLRDEGIDDQFVLTDPTRPTTAKHRFVGRASDRHPHQILRVDRESRAPLTESLAADLWTQLKDHLPLFEAILIPDYLKGVCTEPLLQAIITAARANGQPVLVDPGRTTDYRRYRGATLIKPNRVEAELICGTPLTTAEQTLQAGRSLCETYELDAAIITLDRDGLVVVTPTDHAEIPTEPRAVYDITGAGDMVLATLGLCIASGIDIINAARLANIAAGLEVERFGIAPVKRAEIKAKTQPQRNLASGGCKPTDSSPHSAASRKLASLDEITELATEYRRQGKRIVFTNGCFDLLHVGHVTYLQEAATLGDILIVAINSDDSVRRLKGPSRPVIAEHDRATMLASLECVDHVLIFTEDTPISLLQKIRPDVLIKGGSTAEIVGHEVVEAYGGVVRRAGLIEGSSTTQLIAKMQFASP